MKSKRRASMTKITARSYNGLTVHVVQVLISSNDLRESRNPPQKR